MIHCNAIILMGGTSKRMGYDKSQLYWQGQTMLQKTIGLTQELGCTATYLSCRSLTQSHELDDILAYPKIIDLWKNAGPVCAIMSSIIYLGNIQTASSVSIESKKKNIMLFIPVDLPKLTALTLQRLIDVFLLSSRDALHVVGHPLPLLLDLNSTVRQICQDRIVKPNTPTQHALSVRQFLQHFTVEEYPAQKIEKELFNTNTPKDWQSATGQSIAQDCASPLPLIKPHDHHALNKKVR